MLKIKKELHYRKGNRKAKCSYCTSFVADFTCIGIGGTCMGEQPRCRVIGLNPGRMYRIGLDNLCDRFNDKFSEIR